LLLRTITCQLKLRKKLEDFFKKTVLLNINTNRLFWHSGAGIDSENIFDNYKKYLSKNSDFFNIDKTYKEKVDKLWQKQLEK
jgi:t-SNARE complex subunit (syntaxin)